MGGRIKTVARGDVKGFNFLGREKGNRGNIRRSGYC